MITPKNIKKTGTKLGEIYCLLGCSKQNISYWETYSFNSQFKNSILNVIFNAKKLFNLSEEEKELLANKAGFTFLTGDYSLNNVVSRYKGNLKTLYDNSLVTERMFRYYKSDLSITKPALLSMSIILDLSFSEIEMLLKSYGYCLSKSLINDIVILWFLNSDHNQCSRQKLLYKINETLYEMDLPILATRIREI